MKSILKQTLQYAGFIFFLLVGIVTMFEIFWGGICIIAAGTLLLPTVQKRLVTTPLNNRTRIAIAIICLIVLAPYMGNSNSPNHKMNAMQKRAEQAQAKQQDLRKEAEKVFSRNPEQVLQEISTYVENKNWWMVKTKTEFLLGTDNADIKDLYDEAVAELAREDEERKKQEQERLITGFEEKRSSLIAELRKEIDRGNYAHAQSIGRDYITVADKEFKDLYETAVEKYKTEAAAAPWSYSQIEDPMSKGKSYHASIISSNSVTFDFPYGGAQHATLALRTHPKYGKDIIFSIERGQILCPSYDGCTVRVRFDDEDATSYSAAGAADNSTETIFLRNYSGFIEKMMKAKRVRISLNIYQEGSPVFEFDVSGFNVRKYKPKT